MKVAIFCDKLISTTDIDILNAFNNIFPSAKIYSLIANPKLFRGELCKKSLKASYLNNLGGNEDIFKYYNFLIPSASKKLSIKKDINLVINISSGFALDYGNSAKYKINYIYQDIYKKYKGIGYLFDLYLSKWKKTQLSKSTINIFGNNAIKNIYDDKNGNVLLPVFNLEKFPLKDELIKDGYILINSPSVSSKEANYLINNFSCKFFGNDLHLSNLKLKYPDLFSGMVCNDQLSNLLDKAFLTIDFQRGEFSMFSLASISRGCPLISWDNDISREFLGDNIGISFIDDLYQIKDRINFYKKNINIIKPKLLRNIALKYSTLRFKSGFLKLLNENSIDIF